MQGDLLKKCVYALKGCRARKHGELDASVNAELDDVILRLEHCQKTASNDVRIDVELGVRALEAISRCLNSATNLAEVVRRFFDLN